MVIVLGIHVIDRNIHSLVQFSSQTLETAVTDG